MDLAQTLGAHRHGSDLLVDRADSWQRLCAKIDRFAAAGSGYAVALDPETRAVYERGTPPTGLALDADAIFDA